MNYDANKRLMTFPEGAALESPTASGTATFFTWDLATNEMHGSGGVLVVLKPRPDAPNANEHLLRANRKPIHSKNSLSLQGNKPVIDPTVYS